LRRPLIGPLLSLFLSERAFRRNFRAVFAPGRAPSDDELRQHWQAIARRGGARVYHRLIRYIDERHRYRWRWETALEGAGLPMGFVWGALDPVSGAPILARLRERLPAASFLELPDVGHYPQLEAPAAAAAEVLRFFAGRAGGVS
jgi:pimeloyl-ACP methyl ester carboxylesterase